MSSKYWKTIPVAVGLAVGGLGCLTTGATTDLKTDLDDIQQQLFRVQKDTAELNDKVDEIQQQTRSASLGPGVTGGTTGTMGAMGDERLDLVQNELQILSQRIEEMNFRMDAIVQEIRDTRRQLAILAVPPVAGEEHPVDPAGPGSDLPDGGPVGGMVSPEELYNNAYADYSKGNYQLAVLGFQEYVRRFPDSELADDAQYWVGESYFSSGDFDSAIDAFEDLVSSYPNGNRLASAYYKKGLSYLEENRTPQGVLELQYVIRNYPYTDEARMAKEQLQRLGLAVQ